MHRTFRSGMWHVLVTLIAMTVQVAADDQGDGVMPQEDIERFIAMCGQVPPSAKEDAGDALEAENAGDIDGAISLFKKVNAVDPNLACVRHWLGTLYVKKDKTCRRAMQEFRHAAELEPTFGPNYYEIGLCLHEEGRDDEAIEMFRKTLTLSPNLVAAATEIAQIRERQNRSADSRKIEEKILDRVLLEVPVAADRLADADPFDRTARPPKGQLFQLETFSTPEFGVQFDHPKGWHQTEERHQDLYYVHFSRERAEKRGEFFKVGADVSKYYNANRQMPYLDPNDIDRSIRAAAEAYCQMYLRKGQLISRRHVKIALPDGEGILSLLTFDTDLGWRETEFVIHAYKNNILAILELQAPANEFERYRGLFRRIISTVKLFQEA